MPSIEIDSSERKTAEDLVRKFVVPEFDQLGDAGKFVFLTILLRERGNEFERVKNKFSGKEAKG